jgi:uncharacterized protein YlaN (UPF0358 family)
VVIDEDNAQTVSAVKTVTTPAVNVTIKAPTGVYLGSVTAASQTAVDVSWTAASDDTTPANQLTYEVHLAEGGDFSPSASTLKFSGKNVLSTQLKGLKAATIYSVKLVAIDAQGAKTVSAVKSVTTSNTTTQNTAPTNVKIYAVNPASRPSAIDILWYVATDDTSAVHQITYEVHVAEGGDFTPSAATLKYSANYDQSFINRAIAHQVPDLKMGVLYTVKLVAIDAQGLKTVSSGVTVTPQNSSFNTSPTNVVLGVLQATSPTTVDVSWSAAQDDYTNVSELLYEVHLAEGGDFIPTASTLKFSGKNALSTQLTGLKAATSYSVKLVAIDAQGARTTSVVKSVTITTTNQAPSNVAFNSVTALNATTIEAAWSLAKDDKTIASTMRYQVHLSESANFSPSSTTLKFEQRGGLATQLTGLKASTTYFVKLVVIDEDNAQTVSAVKTVTTPAVNVTIKAPTGVYLGSVTAASQTAVDVSWTAASDDTTPANQLTYEVHLAEGGDFSPSASTLKFSGKNVLSTQLKGLKAATIYSVKLVAIDAQGAKTVSAVKGVSTLGQPVLAVEFLNDTGIRQCIDSNNMMVNCPFSGYIVGQDGVLGRDALAAKGQLTKVGGGDAGFDFTKIGATGQKLLADATTWSCVLDNHTGLMWENKTDDDGLHNKENTYVWYSDAQGYNDPKSVRNFARAVNAQGLCGHKDWRVPTVEELQSIVHYGKFSPAIDEAYFVSAVSNLGYLSSSPVANDNDSRKMWGVAFDYGSVGHRYKNLDNYVRLVRVSQ